jgi:hypothetical protein
VDRYAGQARCGGEWALDQVGAAQELAELDIDLAAITQAGGWKSARMPLQYAEKIRAARTGMARAAADTGRDAEVSLSLGRGIGRRSVPSSESVRISADWLSRH